MSSSSLTFLILQTQWLVNVVEMVDKMTYACSAW